MPKVFTLGDALIFLLAGLLIGLALARTCDRIDGKHPVPIVVSR